MHIKEKEEVLVEMQKPVSLKERSRDHVKIYFQNTQDEEIKRMLPSVVKTAELPDEGVRGFFVCFQCSIQKSSGKNGFVKAETIVEDGIESFYYEWKL